MATGVVQAEMAAWMMANVRNDATRGHQLQRRNEPTRPARTRTWPTNALKKPAATPSMHKPPHALQRAGKEKLLFERAHKDRPGALQCGQLSIKCLTP